MNKDEYQKNLESMNKLVEEMKAKTNCEPCEVHNRFALLFIERMNISGENTKRSEFITDTFKYEYAQCKLVIGTAMLAHNGCSMPMALHVKNEANKNGWVLRHYNPMEFETSNCIAAIRAAFVNIIGIEPRACDIRICLQMGSPVLWKEAKPSDFILLHDQDAEIRRITSFTDMITMSDVAFSQELARYIEEHMKKELVKEEKLAIYKNVKAIMRGQL